MDKLCNKLVIGISYYDKNKRKSNKIIFMEDENNIIIGKILRY